jgi:hypothetical protein
VAHESAFDRHDILGVTVPFFFEGATAVRHSLEHCRLLNCATSASISTFRAPRKIGLDTDRALLKGERP